MLRRDALIRLCRARDLLHETCDSSVSIRDAARAAGFSPYHFIRVFEAVFGETPHQSRIRARLERAKHLLALRDISITEVCLEVGFSSLGSFSDLFTRRVGIAPSAFRRKMRPLVQAPETLPHILIPGCFSLMAGPEGSAIFEKHRRGLSGKLLGSSG